MARLARVVVPGLPHHVTQRGNRRQQTFFRPEDYALYLELMDQWCGEHGVQVWAYCLMPNHVHAILRPLKPKTDPLEKILQSRKRRTSREINSKLGLAGEFWQEESFDRIIRDEEHLDRCLQYIGINPRRGGLSADACPRWVRPTWKALGWDFREP